MASKCGRFFSRSSVSSVKSAFSKSSFNKASNSSFAKPPPPSAPAPSAFRRFSVSRSPVELGAAASMLPLHSAVATARDDVVPELIVSELQISFSGYTLLHFSRSLAHEIPNA